MRAIEKRTLLTYDPIVDINRHLHFHHERMKNVSTTISNELTIQNILPKLLPKNQRRESLSKHNSYKSCSYLFINY